MASCTILVVDAANMRERDEYSKDMSIKGTFYNLEGLLA